MQLTLVIEGIDIIKEPLMKYLADYAWEMSNHPEIYGISTMDDCFTYVVHLMKQFMDTNPTYSRPAGLSVTYVNPACCPASINITYNTHKITLKPNGKIHQHPQGTDH